MTDISIIIIAILTLVITIGVIALAWKLDNLTDMLHTYFNGEILVTEKAWQDIVDDIRHCEYLCQAHENGGYMVYGRYRLYHDLLERFDRGERSRELYWAMLKADLLKTPEERNIK